MGNELAIRIEGLGKRYQLGQVIDLSRTFRETLIDLPRFAWQTLRQKMKMGDGPIAEATGDADTPPGTFWALRDVNLEIKHGEVLGIIGRNGAGKSTLLKIISRITTPTTGRIELFGRVGSLLEVGTGFHPELSGRENIYLNGAILGMRKTEIDKKFDEIVAFAETDKFLDTPIKKYSSGMRVRLAFAVAAHLDPEILIVDEVLAVGDAAFQKKCLGKMGEVAKQGRTVLFVSHNMQMVTALCSRAVLVHDGRIHQDGMVSDIVLRYYSDDHGSMASFDYSTKTKAVGDEYASLLSGSLRNAEGRVSSEYLIDEPIHVQMIYRIHQNTDINYVPNIHVFTADGSYVFYSNPMTPFPHKKGEYRSECVIPPNLMNDRSFSVGLALTSYFPASGMKVNFFEKYCLSFTVKDDLERRNGYSGVIPGEVRPWLRWEIQPV